MQIHEASKSLLLQVPDPFLIRELIPKSKTLIHPQFNIALQHTAETAKVLQNLGINVPSPSVGTYRYPGKYKPYSHQREMVNFLTMHKRAYNLSEMGTGKTAASLWAADCLMEQKLVRKVLMIGKLSTLVPNWMQDVFDLLMHRRGIVVHGSREKRLEAIKRNVEFFFINHDGIRCKTTRDALRRMAEIDLVIVDEGGEFREDGTEKYKALKALIREDQRVWWMTGTPCPNQPTDVWAQVRIVKPSRVPQFFGQFQRQTMNRETCYAGSRTYSKWTPKPGAFDIAFKAMQPAIRFKKEDCLDLPPVTTLNRQAELTREQRAAFKAMLVLMQAEADKRQITAVNAADKIGKLRQILTGCVRETDSGDYITLPHAPRVKLLMETIEEANAKVIVIVPFKGIIRELAKELEKKYTVGVLNGDVSMTRRNAIIADFKKTKDPHVLLCHPAVMAHGLNLTEADMLVFYAPIYSNDQFQQVTERINRPGQKRHMTIVRIAAHPLEWDIYRLVDDKRNMQESMLSLYSSVMKGG